VRRFHILAIERPRESLLTCFVLKAIAANVALPFVFPHLYFRYHTMRYRFDTDGIQRRANGHISFHPGPRCDCSLVNNRYTLSSKPIWPG
jgi:hypothetical protein